MRKFCIALLVVAAILPASAGDKKKNKYILNKVPDQWVELAHVPDVQAMEPCANFAWAAGMESLLERQHVTDFDQKYWIYKIYGGRRCLDSAGDFESLKKQIDGEYVLSNTKKVRLEVHYRESLADTTDQLLLPLAHGRPYILWWKSSPYIVKGATWDEYLYQTGQKMVEVKTIMLLNPADSGKAHEVTFDRTTDDTHDLAAMFDVEVVPLDYDPWAAPHNKALDPVENPALPNPK